jgi:hypothetical protein
MGLGTRKVSIVDGDEAYIEAAASVHGGEQGGKDKHLDADVSLWKALWLFVSNQWLKLGDFVHTAENGSMIKDNFVNVGVVAALLFTMIALDATAVGGEIDEFSSGIVTLEITGQVYVFINSLAMWCLFGSVLHSLYLYIQVSELKTKAEVAYWSESMGFILLNFHFLFLVLGFLFYIFAQVWIVLSIFAQVWIVLSHLGLIAGFISIGLLGLFVAVPLVFASTKSVQSMFNARHHVLEQYRVEQAEKPISGSVAELLSKPEHAALAKYRKAFADEDITLDLVGDMSLDDLRSLLPHASMGHCLMMRRVFAKTHAA